MIKINNTTNKLITNCLAVGGRSDLSCGVSKIVATDAEGTAHLIWKNYDEFSFIVVNNGYITYPSFMRYSSYDLYKNFINQAYNLSNNSIFSQGVLTIGETSIAITVPTGSESSSYEPDDLIEFNGNTSFVLNGGHSVTCRDFTSYVNQGGAQTQLLNVQTPAVTLSYAELFNHIINNDDNTVLLQLPLNYNNENCKLLAVHVANPSNRLIRPTTMTLVDNDHNISVTFNFIQDDGGFYIPQYFSTGSMFDESNAIILPYEFFNLESIQWSISTSDGQGFDGSGSDMQYYRLSDDDCKSIATDQYDVWDSLRDKFPGDIDILILDTTIPYA